MSTFIVFGIKEKVLLKLCFQFILPWALSTAVATFRSNLMYYTMTFQPKKWSVNAFRHCFCCNMFLLLTDVFFCFPFVVFFVVFFMFRYNNKKPSRLMQLPLYNYILTLLKSPMSWVCFMTLITTTAYMHTN